MSGAPYHSVVKTCFHLMTGDDLESEMLFLGSEVVFVPSSCLSVFSAVPVSSCHVSMYEHV